MTRQATHNFHLPLPEPLYRRLRAEAERSGRPATALAREAIVSWLEKQRQAALHAAIAEYAEEMAGTNLDLDTDLEAASVEHLLERSADE